MKATHPRLIHRFINWRHRIRPDTVLNGGPAPTEATDTIDLELKQALNETKAAAFHDHDGGVQVDYQNLKESDAYKRLRQCARRLQLFDPALLTSREEQLGFWINVYNTLTIDAVIAYEIMGTVREVPGFFWRAAYNINGYRYNTSDIEHGVIRSNAGHPAIPGPQFSHEDPRLEHVMDKLDPRIHFALVCAADSCPPINVYDADAMDAQLDLATRAFVNGGGVEVLPEDNTVHLSRIFLWYSSDFGGSLIRAQPLLAYVIPFVADDTTRDWLAANVDRAKIRYKPYDWSLNSLNIT